MVVMGRRVRAHGGYVDLLKKISGRMAKTIIMALVIIVFEVIDIIAIIIAISVVIVYFA